MQIFTLQKSGMQIKFWNGVQLAILQVQKVIVHTLNFQSVFVGLKPN